VALTTQISLEYRRLSRHFILIKNVASTVECFTTTTTPFPEVRPHLAKEYFESKQGECCLRKRCFVNFIHPESFDDIQLGSLLASKWVRHEGDLSSIL
jgi:hypothetical protein